MAPASVMMLSVWVGSCWLASGAVPEALCVCFSHVGYLIAQCRHPVATLGDGGVFRREVYRKGVRSVAVYTGRGYWDCALSPLFRACHEENRPLPLCPPTLYTVLPQPKVQGPSSLRQPFLLYCL